MQVLWKVVHYSMNITSTFLLCYQIYLSFACKEKKSFNFDLKPLKPKMFHIFLQLLCCISRTKPNSLFFVFVYNEDKKDVWFGEDLAPVFDQSSYIKALFLLVSNGGFEINKVPLIKFTLLQALNSGKKIWPWLISTSLRAF